MKRIMYAGSELLTGDAIAAAVMRYSKALADADAAETIEIPVVKADGSRGAATILVGPASQIVAVDGEGSGDEMEDPEVVAGLDEKTRRLHPVARTEEDPDTVDDWISEY
ncbi:hypothetical protein [Microbacterium sp.]|uniref:hypothetical protein n=1 Tax=Microbacterium sp. TaxID=51671 RepID=UPI0025D990E6|nr:hypothetical protein [Microbacterium sp.]